MSGRESQIILRNYFVNRIDHFSYPERCAPAVVLGNGAEGQPSQKAAHCQGGGEEPESFVRLEPVGLAPDSSWPMCTSGGEVRL